jgi:ketosteroid isomerase-like protein
MKIKWPKFFAVLCVLAFAGLPTVTAQHPVTVETLKQFVAAFSAHDLDAVMNFFAEDCELMMPRGPEPWGQRYVGKVDVRKGLEASPMCIMETMNTGFRAITACPDGR